MRYTQRGGKGTRELTCPLCATEQQSHTSQNGDTDKAGRDPQDRSASSPHQCRAVPIDRQTDRVPVFQNPSVFHPAHQGFAFYRKTPLHCSLLIALLERLGSFHTRPGHLGSISGSAAGNSPHFSISPSAIWE